MKQKPKRVVYLTDCHRSSFYSWTYGALFLYFFVGFYGLRHFLIRFFLNLIFEMKIRRRICHLCYKLKCFFFSLSFTLVSIVTVSDMSVVGLQARAQTE